MPEGTQVLQSFKSATEGAQKAEQELPSTTAPSLQRQEEGHDNKTEAKLCS